MAIGRISGPLLKANLLRNGVDLAFETDLLYLDVINGRIGIKTDSPTHDLTVNGTTRTTNLDVTTQADIATFTISSDTIASSSGTINLEPAGANPVVYQGKIVTGDLQISTNVIETTATDQNLEIRTLGTGEVKVYSNVYVDGNVHATGTITADGNITIGNSDVDDNVIFNADIASDIIPNADAAYDLGSNPSTGGKEWKNGYLKNVFSTSITANTAVVNGIVLEQPQGNTVYVAVNGSDTNAGIHQNNPLATIKTALAQAESGDTVYVYPGTYEEILPLEIPAGVTLKGAGLRSVTVKPTAATRYLDMFHMNGEATLEDFTLMGFYHNPSGTYSEFPGDTNGTGHAVRFSYGCLTQSRSPYVRNISVITRGTPSLLSVDSIKTEVIGSLTRIKSLIPDIVQNNVVTGTTGNTEVQNTSLTASDATTGTILQGLIDTVIYVINNGTTLGAQPTLVANGSAVTAGMLYNAAQILEANRNWIVQESYSYPTVTYAPTTFDETLTKRDMGLVLDALIYDILRGGNEHSYYAGFGFWVQPSNDPLGYDRGDAGHGALVDAEVLNVGSVNRAMLFHSVTFITPNAETLIVKNGARVEWLNSFTYFANKGMLLTSGANGFAGQGKTRLRIDSRIGTWAVGNTLSYYDTDGTTLLASGVISSIDGNYVTLTGKCEGFQTITDRAGKTVYAQGDAKLSTSFKKFGSASLALDGTGDYASLTTQPDFEFGTGDFCLETWVYPTTTGTYRTLFDLRSTAGDTGGIILGISDINALYFYYNGNYRIGPVGSVTQNAWSHIALARVAGETRAFINGTQVGLTYTDTNNYAQRGVRIGADPNGTYAFAGYMDDLRISKGAGRYSTTFTAPTSALVGDLNTVLLLHFNGAENSTVIFDDGVTLQDLRTSAGGTASLVNFADYSEFGAEVRSIGSACVYGNYGAYGDGVGITAYLISHNFAYVGAGKLSTNDPNDRIAANEVTEINGAQIHYTSVDNEGNFSVGDAFYVNQKTGDILFNGTTTNITSATGVTFSDGVNTTVITPADITTGNIRISGNTVESLTGDLNVVSASGNINLQNNTNITGNLDVTGDITIGGNITIGNQATDTVEFVGKVNSDIVPDTNNAYDLGSNSPTELRWKNAYLNRIEIDGLVIDNNSIATTLNNDDLTLTANGTGRIYIPDNDVQIDQNLTVNGVVTSNSLEVTTTITADKFAVTDIEITDNYITTTVTNSDLELLANGTGRIYVPSNNVVIENDLTVNGTTNLANVNVGTALAPKTVTHIGDVNQTGDIDQTGNYTLTGNLTAQGTTTELSDVRISTNTITTIGTDLDLELSANGTGKITIPTNDVSIGQDLTVNGTAFINTLEVTTTITSNKFTTGNIEIDDNYITTTVADSNLELSANGTGKIYVPNNNVQIDQNLTVDGTTTLGVTNIGAALAPKTVTHIGTLTHTGNVNQTGDYELTGNLTVQGTTAQFKDIKLLNNLLTTTVTDSNLELVANGTGKIYVPSNDVLIDQNLTVTTDLTVTTGTTYLKNTEVTGTITQTGNIDQTGDFTTSGNTEVTGNITGTGYLQLSNIRIEGNTVSTTITDSDLQLTANGTGNVIFEGFKFQDNNIQSVVTDSDLIFTPQGTGSVIVNSTQSLVLPVGNTAERPGTLVRTPGMIRFNSELSQYEGWTGSHWLKLSGVQDLDGNTKITAELTPGENDNIIRFYVNGSLKATIDSTKLYTDRIHTNDLDIYDNVITTQLPNTDINITTTGTGGVKVGNLRIHNNIITNVTANAITEFVQTGTGYVKIGGTNGVVIPSGDTENDRPIAVELGLTRWNTTTEVMEIFDGVSWTSVAGTAGGVTADQAENIGIVSAILFG